MSKIKGTATFYRALDLPPVVGIHGMLHSGKDSAARILLEAYGYVQGIWADALKDFTCRILGWDRAELEAHKDEYLEEWGCTARHIMQTLGTDWGRKMVHPDIWVRLATRELAPKVTAGAKVVFSDVRFENEADAIRAMGGVIWHVRRPGLEADGYAARGHDSENGIEFKGGDLLLVNNGTLQQYASLVRSTLHYGRERMDSHASSYPIPDWQA